MKPRPKPKAAPLPHLLAPPPVPLRASVPVYWVSGEFFNLTEDNRKSLPPAPVPAAAASRESGNEERQELQTRLTACAESRFDPPEDQAARAEVKLEPDEKEPHDRADARAEEVEMAKAVDSAIETKDPVTLAWLRMNYETLIAEAQEADDTSATRSASYGPCSTATRVSSNKFRSLRLSWTR